MGRLGVIGGHSILGSAYGEGAERREHRVGGGAVVTVLDAGSHAVVHRHGIDSYTPAHRVDHVANLQALGDSGCDRVLAISSVGGLRSELGVGTFLAPDDFIALDTVVSAHHDERSHLVPGVRRRVAGGRRRVRTRARACASTRRRCVLAGAGPSVRDTGRDPPHRDVR